MASRRILVIDDEENIGRSLRMTERARTLFWAWVSAVVNWEAGISASAGYAASADCSPAMLRSSASTR